jgi:hypothetical protein
MAERTESAVELAGRVRDTCARIWHQGEYSVEAGAIMAMYADLADVAERLAMLEEALKDDLPMLIRQVLEGQRPPLLPPERVNG